MDGRECTNWFSTGAITPCREAKIVLKPPKVTPNKSDYSVLKNNHSEELFQAHQNLLTEVSLNQIPHCTTTKQFLEISFTCSVS